MTTFLYDSFSGGSGGGRYSDSPKYVFEEARRRWPDAEHLWIGDDRSTFPDDVRTISQSADNFADVLSRTDVIVANSYTPHFAGKPAGALFVQTWHGTPLKRICFDSPRNRPELLEELAAEIRRWDTLISPSDFCSEVLPKAFRFTGDVWQTGYPRNDVLLSDERDALRDRVRRQLGIADGKTVVLYAPTWRDTVLSSTGGRGVELRLDVERMMAELGDDHVLLLRLHYYIADRLDISHPSVIDVSDHPDISQLYLATDALITDYSSVMFDFAVTGKPIVFYTYDLEHYRDDVRGFYFEFEVDAPGPLMTTTEDVIAALQSLDGIKALYGDAYDDFRERFCSVEDGHAAERVVDLIAGSLER